jgi:arylsulfatase A
MLCPLLITSLLVGLFTACRPAQASEPLPNFIVLFTDDQGYQDLGCFGSPHIATPNIDRLATEGIKFTDFYAAYAVCSASRASLLTGCYAPRVSMPGVLWPRSRVGLHPDEVTLADLLKTRGYATACIGKWHVGDAPETLPTSQGFDSYFGIPYSNNMARQRGWGNNAEDLDKIWAGQRWDIFNNALVRNEEVVESPVNQTTLTDRYTEAAVAFIEEHRTQPFFLYFASTMPHMPLFVSESRFDPDPQTAYQRTIEHIDWAVGRMLETLDAHGIADNTFIIYTSDNGPWLSMKHHGGSALPLRDGKGTTYEGGMRVPCVVRWPARVPPGQVCRQVAATIDLLPTFASLVGAPLPADRPIDGHDITPLLEDPTTPSPYDTHGFFYYRNQQIEAVRLGKWKLRLNADVELYDLRADIGETTNLAASEPALVQRLRLLADRYDENLKANVRPAWTKPKSPGTTQPAP